MGHPRHRVDCSAEIQNPFPVAQSRWRRPVPVLTIVGDRDGYFRLVQVMHEFFNLFRLHWNSGKRACGKRQANQQRPQQMLDGHKVTPGRGNATPMFQLR